RTNSSTSRRSSASLAQACSRNEARSSEDAISMAWANSVSALRTAAFMSIPLRLGFHLTMRIPAGNVLTHFWKNAKARGASASIKLSEQPGPGVSPMALGRCAADAEHLGGLLETAAREEPELDDLSLLRVEDIQPPKRLVERHEVNRVVLGG